MVSDQFRPCFVEAEVHMRQTLADSLADGGSEQELLLPDHDDPLDLIVKELQHRMRNVLSVVQCFVTNTEAGTAGDFREALTARIVSLSDAYSMLEDASGECVLLADLLERTLKPHGTYPGGRIFLAGPTFFLKPKTALSLHIVFHELATNASKHGSLTSPSGRIEVLWDVPADHDGRAIAIQWREQGGPKVQKPSRRGFGTTLLAKILPGSRVELDFAPDGLVCRLLLNLTPGAGIE
jgi:two-component sensor histidine kinase